jgi:hypothetical protein
MIGRQLQLQGRGMTGASFAAIARMTGAFGVVPSDNDTAVMNKFADYAIEENPGFQSTIPGPPTFTTLATFRAAPVSNRKQALLDPSYSSGDYYFETVNAPYTEALPNVIKADSTALSVGAWVRQSAKSIVIQAPGEGGIIEPLESTVNRTGVDVQRYGASGNGLVVDTYPLRLAIAQARLSLSDGSRTFATKVKIPAGRYLFDDELDLAENGSVTGLTICGDGAGSTEFVRLNGAARIIAPGSRDLTFRDLTIRTLDKAVDTDIWSEGDPYGLALGGEAFGVWYDFGPGLSTLRSWRFERVTMSGHYKCFDVEGTAMCSEFYFDTCQFYQNFILKHNKNDQAVNWAYVNCNWENEALDTTGTDLLKKDAKAFWFEEGDFVSWKNGSIIGYGQFFHFDATSDNVFTNASHKFILDSVRIERSDDAGTSAPLFGRREDGYEVAGNSVSISMVRSTVLLLGAISDYVYSDLWDGSNITIDDCRCEDGKIIGVYGPASSANLATLSVTNTTGLSYVDDKTGKISSHIKHNVDIPGFHQRSDSLSKPYLLNPIIMYFRGPTGSLPLGGTTVNIDILNDYTVLRKFMIRRFTTGDFPLTVQLCDQADTLVFAQAVLASGTSLTADAEINLEMGFQLPTGTPLMFKFIGSPEQIKGFVGLELI